MQRIKGKEFIVKLCNVRFLQRTRDTIASPFAARRASANADVPLLLPSLQLRDILPLPHKKSWRFFGRTYSFLGQDTGTTKACHVRLSLGCMTMKYLILSISGKSKAGTTYYTFEPPSKSPGCFYEQNSRAYMSTGRVTDIFLTLCHYGEGLSESSEAGGLKICASLSADAFLPTINFSISVESSSSREARARIVYAVTTSEPTRRRRR